MELESLSMRRMTYGVNEGKLDGEIMFKNPKGKVQLMLNDETCQKLLSIVAEGMVEVTKDVASTLTADILTAAPRLENKVRDEL